MLVPSLKEWELYGSRKRAGQSFFLGVGREIVKRTVGGTGTILKGGRAVFLLEGTGKVTVAQWEGGVENLPASGIRKRNKRKAILLIGGGRIKGAWLFRADS